MIEVVDDRGLVTGISMRCTTCGVSLDGQAMFYGNRNDGCVECGVCAGFAPRDSAPTIKDSGTRREFASGAVRDMQAGRGRCDLLPPRAILRLARHYEAGCAKYGDRNWEKGIPINSFIDSGIRHILKYMAGETDEDHLVAAAWNLMCAMETEEVHGFKFDRGEAKGSE